MMPGSIAWRDVAAWSEHHGLDGEQRDFLDKCIRAMDGTFMDWQAAKAAANTPAPKKSRGGVLLP